MKVYFEKFQELTYDELLEVNGGYSSSSGKNCSSESRKDSGKNNSRSYSASTNGLDAERYRKARENATNNDKEYGMTSTEESKGYDAFTNGLDAERYRNARDKSNYEEFNWADSYDDKKREYEHQGIPIDEKPTKGARKITKTESDYYHKFFNDQINDGWTVCVTHPSRCWGRDKHGEYTEYNLFSPDGHSCMKCYDMNNDGVIDYAE